MDRSNNNNTNSAVDCNSLADDNSRPIDINNSSKKRKRNDDESATSSPSDSPGEESREQHNTTLLQRALEQSQRVNELLSENRELFSENRKLRIELDKRKKEVEEKDREIEALRGELEGRFKSDHRNQSDSVTHTGNSMVTSDVPGNGGVKIREKTIDRPTTELNESTDEEIQLSSTSSNDRRLDNCRQLHNAVDDEAEVEKSDERKLSSDTTTSAMSYSQLFGDDGADEEKEMGGETEDVKQHALDDTGLTKSNNDSTEAMEGEQEQHAVTEYAAAINHGEDIGEDGKVDSEADTASHADAVDISRAEQEEEESDDEVVKGDGRLAFCCQNCTCNKLTTLYPCHNSAAAFGYFGNIKLWHKGCCHNESGVEDDFKSPMQLCREEGFSMEYKSTAAKECSLDSIKKKYANAMKRVSEMANEEFLAAPGTEILSCREYEDECRKFLLAIYT